MVLGWQWTRPAPTKETSGGVAVSTEQDDIAERHLHESAIEETVELTKLRHHIGHVIDALSALQAAATSDDIERRLKVVATSMRLTPELAGHAMRSQRRVELNAVRTAPKHTSEILDGMGDGSGADGGGEAE